MELPKLLIVSRLVWDDNSNSNTLTNFFSGYDPEKIARIYIETKHPRTKCCHHFYQISEISLLKKIVRRNTKTGFIIDTLNEPYQVQKKDELGEQRLMSFARRHRMRILTYLRDVLWSFNGWKSRELTEFVKDFDPDILWLDGSPLILMNRLNNYVSSISNKPSVTFLMDDVYTFKSCPSLIDRFYKIILRKHVRETVHKASHVFVASPKMKQEYDDIFGINSTFIAKGIHYDELTRQSGIMTDTIRMVYFGNLLIGRLQSLILIAEAIKRAKDLGLKVCLDIYSADSISVKDRKSLMTCENVRLMDPVPYQEVSSIMETCEVVVFVEALTGTKKNIARLSFSTKIVDYIGSGKCIFAVGPDDSAPIEYLRDNRIALVASNKEQVFDNLMSLNSEIIREYSQRVNEFGHDNHDISKTQKVIYDKLYEVYMRGTEK